jgi:hypothetical protein
MLTFFFKIRRLTANDLLARVQYAINRLEDASKEDQKAVFESVIQFAEFHPQKLRLGVLAGPAGSSMFMGSTTIKNGGVGEIRTLEWLSPLNAFQAFSFDRSDTTPHKNGEIFLTRLLWVRQLILRSIGIPALSEKLRKNLRTFEMFDSAHDGKLMIEPLILVEMIAKT